MRGVFVRRLLVGAGVGAAMVWASSAAAQPNPAGIDWQALPGLQIARSGTMVTQFARFAQRWWHSALQTRAEYLQSKPADTTVVSIGWRCVRAP